MRRIAILVVLTGLPYAVRAADAPKAPQCVELVPGADYVPGVDAYGRKVAPADVENETTPDLKSVTVVPRVTTPGNQVVKDAQVVVDLKKAPPPSDHCPPVPVPKPER
jgi:hypothetical protein